MRKRDRQRRYRSLLEKDYRQAIISDVAQRFDLSRTSWLCETIVDEFSRAIEEWERGKDIERLKPGELLLPYKGKHVVVDLLDKKALELLVETKLFLPYKKRILEKNLDLLKHPDEGAGLADVHSLISLRDTVPRWQEGTNLEDLQVDPSFPLVKPETVGFKLNKLKPANIRPPDDITQSLITYCVEKCGLTPFAAGNIMDYFLRRRSCFLPLKSDLKPGQIVWLGTSIKKSKMYGCLQIRRRQIPVILTLYSSEELDKKPTDLSQLNEQMMQQLARITTEAYLQETLLSDDELQMFYLRSASVISKLLRKYMKVKKVILPTPGSILDLGTMFTHKELIIDLSMQGYYSQEIAKKTYHEARSVDAYLRTFNSILILWYYGLPMPLISMVTERGVKVVKEHINIIKKYFPEKPAVKRYLDQRGIAV